MVPFSSDREIKMSFKTFLLATALTVTTGAAYADSHEAGTVVDGAVNSPDHTTLVAAVQAAGLVETLSGDGPFTVFAPTNDAFGMLAKGTVEDLLKPENNDALTKVLTCHVVAADVMSDALAKMISDDGGVHPVPTVGGCTLQAMVVDGMVKIEDERGRKATVTVADIKQSNGVIHVIDTVLLPAQ